MDWLYSLSGFLVGLIVGVTGVGGGSLMTPLSSVRRRSVTAVGTDLLFCRIDKTGGAWAHARRGKSPGTSSAGSRGQRTGFRCTLVLLHLFVPDPASFRQL